MSSRKSSPSNCPSMDDLDKQGKIQSPHPRRSPSKPRSTSATESLADWFWTQVLKESASGRHTQPNYRRLLGQAAYMTKRMNLSPSQVKTAIKMMLDHGEIPENLSACYLFIEKTSGKSWYDYAADPWRDAPPWYDTCRYIWWLERYFPDDPDLKTFSVTPNIQAGPYY